jgi:type I site-specific restriction-modification system R (restriction) subunit
LRAWTARLDARRAEIAPRNRMLIEGVTIEYRRKDGSIAGAQARVIDFDAPPRHDWLAVNQFTVSEGTAHPPAGRGAVP